MFYDTEILVRKYSYFLMLTYQNNVYNPDILYMSFNWNTYHF